VKRVKIVSERFHASGLFGLAVNQRGGALFSFEGRARTSGGTALSSGREVDPVLQVKLQARYKNLRGKSSAREGKWKTENVQYFLASGAVGVGP
jgi:hypothetical protein